MDNEDSTPLSLCYFKNIFCKNSKEISTIHLKFGMPRLKLFALTSHLIEARVVKLLNDA